MIHNEKLALQKALDQRQPGGVPQAEFAEISKRLKKRELECQALWDTIKDIKQAGKDIFDVSEVVKVLAKRALDTKAGRKLGISK